MDKQRKNFLVNGMLLLVSVALTLAVAEVVLRQVYPANMNVTGFFRVPHPAFGWSLKKDVQYINRLPEELVTVAYNSRGFRDIEHARQGADDRSRIVVLGDSFMEGYSVNLQDSFSRVLEDRLSDQGRESEVINLGVGGYGTLQELLVWESEGKQYQPALVLLGVYLGNDLSNNLFELESAFAKSTDLALSSRPFLDATSDENFAVSTIDFEGSVERYETALIQSEGVWPRLVRRFRVLVPVDAALATASKQFRKGRDRALSIARNDASVERRQLALYGVHACKPQPLYETSWRVTRKILEKLRASVAETGARLVLFSVPAQPEVDSESMRKVIRKFRQPDVYCLEAAPGYARLASLTDELGIDYIDLLPRFQSTRRESNVDLFRDSDHHWNPAGHALAATVIAERLVELSD